MRCQSSGVQMMPTYPVLNNRRTNKSVSITEWLRLKGTSGGLCEAGPPTAYCPGPFPLLNTSRDGNSTTSLSNLCQCLVTNTVKKCFLMFRQNSCVPFCAVSGSFPGHHWERPGAVFFTPSLQKLTHIDEFPSEPFLLQAAQAQPSALSLYDWCPSPSIIAALRWTLSIMSTSVVLGRPKLDPALQV